MDARAAGGHLPHAALLVDMLGGVADRHPLRAFPWFKPLFTELDARGVPYLATHLEHLDALGAPVLNGATAFRYELSKAAQCSLMARLGIRHPATRGGALATKRAPDTCPEAWS